MAPDFKELIRLEHRQTVSRWSWRVPSLRDDSVAKREAELVGDLAEEFELDGMIMDAEGTSAFFFMAAWRKRRLTARRCGKLPAGSKAAGDIRRRHSAKWHGWLPKFNEIARKAHINFPQTYYGASPSVLNDRRPRGEGRCAFDESVRPHQRRLHREV